MAHVVHLVNREYGAMARDYYTLGFLDSVSSLDSLHFALLYRLYSLLANCM